MKSDPAMKTAALIAAMSIAAACSAAHESTPQDIEDAGGGQDASASPDTSTAPDASIELGEVEPGEDQSGGAATTTEHGARAFAQPIAGLAAAARTEYFSGQAIFEMNWVPPTSAPNDRAGLGPTYNSTSCQACHVANGRGAPPLGSGEAMITELLRVSVAGVSEHGGPVPHPVYGDQIQPAAIAGTSSEGAVRVFYTEVAGSYADGTPYTLLRPSITFEPKLGDPGEGLLLSPRVAAATFGMGLLDAIPEEDILAHADPDDADGDGISGRANRVWNATRATRSLGRFGWKANQPTVVQQNAGAFVGDIGITTPIFPTENCPPAQTGCSGAPSGPAPELVASRLEAVTMFMRATGVPSRRRVDDLAVLRGKHLFKTARCTSCHTPKMRTGPVPDVPQLSQQTIWPYTDLLVHDMGEELADGRPDFEATGREWRTPPLWGLGLQSTVSGHERLLHDGRARGFAEAILWHGGEAQTSADAFREMPRVDREALVAFLTSL